VKPDIEAIKRAMQSRPHAADPQASPKFAGDLALEAPRSLIARIPLGNLWWKRRDSKHLAKYLKEPACRSYRGAAESCSSNATRHS